MRRDRERREDPMGYRKDRSGRDSNPSARPPLPSGPPPPPRPTSPPPPLPPGTSSFPSPFLLDAHRRTSSPPNPDSFAGGDDDTGTPTSREREREMEEKRLRVRERLRIMERKETDARDEPRDRYLKDRDRSSSSRDGRHQRDASEREDGGSGRARDRDRDVKARIPPAKAKAIPKLVAVGKHTVVSRALGGNWKLIYDPQLERHYPPAYLAEPEVRQAVKEKRGRVYRVDGVCPGVVRFPSSLLPFLSLFLACWLVDRESLCSRVDSRFVIRVRVSPSVTQTEEVVPTDPRLLRSDIGLGMAVALSLPAFKVTHPPLFPLLVDARRDRGSHSALPLQPDENLFDPKLPRTVFISGIAPSVDKELLLEEFSSMGVIEDVRRHNKPSSRSNRSSSNALSLTVFRSPFFVRFFF